MVLKMKHLNPNTFHKIFFIHDLVFVSLDTAKFIYAEIEFARLNSKPTRVCFGHSILMRLGQARIHFSTYGLNSG